MAKPILEEAIRGVYMSLLPERMAVVDLGCSSGPNTLKVVSEVLDVIGKLRRSLGRQEMPEILFFLNDLPGNDFNHVFRSLGDHRRKVEEEKGNLLVPYYVVGVPGSFYGRLFPCQSVHFFNASFPKVPPCRTKLRRKNGIVISRKERELSTLGRHGILFRPGIIEEEKLVTFNLPLYSPSMEEVKAVIHREDLFDLEQAQIFEANWDPFDGSDDDSAAFDSIVSGKNVAGNVRAVVQSLIAEHFGDAILDELFSIYEANVPRHLLQRKSKHYVFVISLKKKEEAEADGDAAAAAAW
ncbi:hypothetical protein BHE74_00054603 [Ensete ventricosum]|nr:hypothetical protein BHE74_00054603 [Ensete ventricosum]